MTVKIIRLKTGEDIIALAGYAGAEQEGVLLEYPFNIVTRFGEGVQMVLLLPYIPYDVVDDFSAVIKYEDIMFTMTPRKEIEEYYQSQLEILQTRLKNKLAIVNYSDLVDSNNSNKIVTDSKLH